MIDEIVVMYAITDDLLKAIAHQEDCRRTMSDAPGYNISINSFPLFLW
jgi:hypothetical protein